MSKFVMYKLKDGRVIRGRYNHDTDKVLISQEDLEGLLNESNVAYEQAKQLQTIIENLQEIKTRAIRKALDEIKAKIEALQKDYHEYGWAYDDVLEIIDKYRAESEEEDEMDI